jgi:Fe2+ or Zn2+ uptake regulation protein
MTTTYHNKDNYMEVECDGCNETIEFEGDFEDCIEQIKEEGWWIRNEKGNWTHYCEDCKTKEL